MKRESMSFGGRTLLLFARDHEKNKFYHKFYLVLPTKFQSGWGELKIGCRANDTPENMCQFLDIDIDGLPSKNEEPYLGKALNDFNRVFEDTPLNRLELELFFETIANYEKLRNFSSLLKNGGSGYSNINSKNKIKNLEMAQELDDVIIPSVLKDLLDILEPRQIPKLKKESKENLAGDLEYLLGEQDGHPIYLELPKKEGGSWGHIFVAKYYSSGSNDVKTFPEIFFNQKQETFDKFKECFDKTTLEEDEVWKILELIQSYYTVKNYSMFARSGRSGFTTLKSSLANLAVNFEEAEKVDNVIIPEIITELKEILKG